MNKNRHRFTIEEIKTIERLYPNHTNREIAQIIGCTVYAINNRAHMMGLKKPIEFVMKTNRTLGKKLRTRTLVFVLVKGIYLKIKGKGSLLSYINVAKAPCSKRDIFLLTTL